LDVCFSWAEIIDGEGRSLKHPMRDTFNQPGRNSQEILEKLQVGNYLLAPSAVRRRRCYHYFASNVVLFGLQDYALWLQMLRRHRARILEVPLLKYRIHGTNVSLSRFSDDYRALEAIAARRFAEEPQVVSSRVARESVSRQLLRSVERMMQYQDFYTEAYIAANRAVNLNPTGREGYDVLASLLSQMGHEEPARIVHSIGQVIDETLGYPLPLLKSSETVNILDSSPAPVQDTVLPSGTLAREGCELDLRTQLESERNCSKILLRQTEEERDHLWKILRKNEDERNRTAIQARDFELNAKVIEQERNRLAIRVQEITDEREDLAYQLKLAVEQREQLRDVLRFVESERDKVTSHLRAVANGRIMRLLNKVSQLSGKLAVNHKQSSF
jgi:hypothetical protein